MISTQNLLFHIGKREGGSVDIHIREIMYNQRSQSKQRDQEEEVEETQQTQLSAVVAS